MNSVYSDMIKNSQNSTQTHTLNKPKGKYIQTTRKDRKTDRQIDANTNI